MTNHSPLSPAVPLQPQARAAQSKMTDRIAGAFAAAVAAAALAFLASLLLGESEISLESALTQPGSTDALVLFSLRLPRACLACLVGASLGLSGAALQSLLRNPLADPFILGVSGGAALGATASLAAGGMVLGTFLSRPCALLPGALTDACAAIVQSSPTAAAALLCALTSTLLVCAAASGSGRLYPVHALLAGVVFNALAAAAITLIKSLSPPGRLGNLTFWLSGSIPAVPWPQLLAAAAVLTAAAARILSLAHALNLLSLGRDQAAVLGLDADRAARALFLWSSLLVAVTVSLSGMIGFVGLIVPHLIRRLAGADNRRLLPLSALLGAAVLLLADLASRLLLPAAGTILPVGALTALAGAPFFLVLLRRRSPS